MHKKGDLKLFVTSRLREAKILLIGLKALNAEVCKNIVLAGVNSVTILDHETATEEDLGAHIFLEESDIGKNVFFIFLREFKFPAS